MARAEVRFEKSRDAVQGLLKLGAELIQKPQMELVGRSVLQNANRLQETLLDEKSDDPATRLETAHASRTYGWTQLELGQRADAEVSTQKTVALVRFLLAERPDDLGGRRELRSALAQLAVIQRGFEQFAAAEESYHEAIRLGEELVALPSSRIDDQSSLANILTNFSIHQSSQGQRVEARKSIDRAVEILRGAVQKQPRSTTVRGELTLALTNVAAMEWSQNRDAAEKLGREALKIRRQLLREQPNSRELPGYLYRKYQQVADWCLATGRTEEAEQLLQEGFDGLVRAVGNHPYHAGLRRGLLDAIERRHPLAMKRGETDQADALLLLQVEHARVLVANLPTSTTDRYRLARALTTWARRQAVLGQKESAAPWFLDAIAEFKRLNDDAQDQTKYREAILKLMNEFARLGAEAAPEEQMIALWEDWLRRVPMEVAALNELAWRLSMARDPQRRDPGRAVELAEKAVSLQPNSASFHNTLGTALYRADRLAAARAELEKSLELKSREPAIDWYLLAAIAYREGKLDEARELHDRAAAEHQQKHPNDEDHAILAAEVKALLH